MEDVDESTSENNITINGINRFAGSRHQFDNNVYHFTVVKDAGSNSYRSRIGFNMHPFLFGYYTLVVEFLPPTMMFLLNLGFWGFLYPYISFTNPQIQTINSCLMTITIDFCSHPLILTNFEFV